VSRPTILLTGSTGQLGFELSSALRLHGELASFDHASLDLSDTDALVRTVRSVRPRLIVNAAGYTAVDRAESEPEKAHAVNGVAPGILAEEARRSGALLIHYSTDYVFDGTASTPYTEDAPAAPLNAYGRSKLAGERAIAESGANSLIFRTSWVYGLRGSNFLLTIRRLAAERDELRVVADQIGAPNWTRALAETTAALVARGLSSLIERAGVYHLSAGGSTSWFEFARAILGDAPRPRLLPITTGDYPTAARRPAYSVLSTVKFEAAFGIRLAHWRDMLARCLSSGDPPSRASPSL
jgi:dTDP-4-dehydrorhamnose reductase